MRDRGGVTDWKAVGARIREQREARGLTQSQLGEVVRSSANYVTKVEGGLGISDTKLDAYAKALGVSVPFLRYGVAGGPEDIALARTMGAAEERQRILDDLQKWVGNFVADRTVPLEREGAVETHRPETPTAARRSGGGRGKSA